MRATGMRREEYEIYMFWGLVLKKPDDSTYSYIDARWLLKDAFALKCISTEWFSKIICSDYKYEYVISYNNIGQTIFYIEMRREILYGNT